MAENTEIHWISLKNSEIYAGTMASKSHMLYCKVFAGPVSSGGSGFRVLALIVCNALRLVNERSLVNGFRGVSARVLVPAVRVVGGGAGGWVAVPVDNAGVRPGGGTARGVPAPPFPWISLKITEFH